MGLWSETERQSLVVWADMLQSRGEPLGQLVAASLRVEQLGEGPPVMVELLRQQVAKLEAQLLEPLAPWWPWADATIDQSWTHGMLTSLRIVVADGLDPIGTNELLDGLARALRHPCTKFLRQLRIDARRRDWSPLHGEVLSLLAERETVARPWSLVLGTAPHDQRRHTALARLDFDAGQLGALALDRGLRSLHVHGCRIDLPWTPGDKRTRLRAANALLEGPDIEPTTLARALWDPSLRVRLAVIDRVPLLGEDAAAFVPELLLVDRGELHWLRRVTEVLAHLAKNEAVVAAVAANFTIDQPRCAGWLAASQLEVAQAAGPRLAAMIEDRRARSAVRRQLRDAAAKLTLRRSNRELARSLDPRTPGSRPLLRRLRRWLTG